MFLLKVGFTACLCKCWSLNFNLKKAVLTVIVINAASVWLNDCWQTGPLFLSIITVRLFQGVSAVLQGFCFWDGSLSLLNIWCHQHFMMEEITCSGLENENVFHSVLSTISLFSIHQSRYLILRNSSAVFFIPFMPLIETLSSDQVRAFWLKCQSVVVLFHESVSEESCFFSELLPYIN